MLTSIFATKIGMSQAWDVNGKRWAVTKCKVAANMVLGNQDTSFLIGYGPKKLANVPKPQRTILTKGGFSSGVKQIQGVRAVSEATEPASDAESANTLKIGDTVSIESVLSVGDVVKVQGTSKGRGFAGAMKRHNFHGGPATHGQSDRARAVGSIGAGTTPGKVLKGKKMPGHYGHETKTVSNLVVLYIDQDTQEVWLSGPVPGHIKSTVRITPTGKTKEIELNTEASGIQVKPEQPAPQEESSDASSASTTDDTPEKTKETKETKE